MFKDKILLITGGTGSFGNEVLKAFLDTNIKEIRIFSRDEKKQDDMRKKYNSSKLKFYIGDVRQKSTIDIAMKGVDYVFHAAALKQVPSCEFFPLEAVKTNVIGTDNVLTCAINHKVKKIICLSTDKAAYPINAMGISKAMMEKIIIAKARQLGEGSETTICLTRYGNVMGSRGSVIPLFYKLISEGKPLTITDPNMTRYMMTLKDAVDLVIFAFKNGNQGDLFVQKAPAATIDTLALAIKKHKGSDVDTVIIGTRHGEKAHEVLVTREEMSKAEDLGDFYRIPMDNRDMNYNNFYPNGQGEVIEYIEYSSDKTNRIDEDGVIELLNRMGDIET
ncbi:MAG TPA: polysaccharide biosynthesis protein [Candidatus Saccharibacteria bacterium]|nr:polysaccharide biosynthesis protein [Candidatus Saccharibacteria bacterium]